MYHLKILPALLFLGLTPLQVTAAQFDHDASAQLGSISFSESQLYAGEQVRIYGALVNLGNKDIRGTVIFYQGAVSLGEPQFFSLKAQSAPEDFWVDWRPSEGTYNISMSLVSTEPVDQNPGNNTAVTGMLNITKRPPPPPPPPPPAPTPAPVAVAPRPVSSPPTQANQKQSATLQIQKTLEALAQKNKVATAKKEAQSETRKQSETSEQAASGRSYDAEKEIMAQYGDEAVSDIVDTTKPVPFAPVYSPSGVIETDTGKKLLFLLTGFAGLALAFGGLFWVLSKREE